MWHLLATDPEKLKRFAAACREWGCSTPGVVHTPRAGDWGQIQLPAGWQWFPSGHSPAIIPAAGEMWVGFLTDDMVPSSPNWDQALVGQVRGWNMVLASTGLSHGEPLVAATVFSPELLRRIGPAIPPGMDLATARMLWGFIARETACVQTVSEARVRLGDQPRGLVVDDPTAYESWRAQSGAAAIAAVHQIIADRGGRRVSFDFRGQGIDVMLATPCMDGKFESTFMESWFHTMHFLTNYGAKVQFKRSLYTADVSLARANLFAEFLRSPCTHLLMIDADMGWHTDAIIRLFAAGKDFVAVAGPKKFYPLTFAARHVDAQGNGLTLNNDPETGCAELQFVGGAFVLVTRAVCEALAKAHPELEYKNGSGQSEWGVFDPMYRDGLRLSEDYAFCRRWRDLGGQVHVCIDVPLSHTGAHTFHGDMATRMGWAPGKPEMPVTGRLAAE